MLADSRAAAVLVHGSAAGCRRRAGRPRAPRVVDLVTGPPAAGRSRQLSRCSRAGRPAGELAYVIFTSGSTGAPKGVAVTARRRRGTWRAGRCWVAVRRWPGAGACARSAFDASMLELWSRCSGGRALVRGRRPRCGPTPAVLAGLVRRRGCSVECGACHRWRCWTPAGVAGVLSPGCWSWPAADVVPRRRRAGPGPPARAADQDTYGPTEATVCAAVYQRRLARPAPDAAADRRPRWPTPGCSCWMPVAASRCRPG